MLLQLATAIATSALTKLMQNAHTKTLVAQTPLLLTWYDSDGTEAPHAPPATPATSEVATSVPSIRKTRGKNKEPEAAKRHSLRLAEKAPASFVDMTDKAIKLKALQNSLQPCSAALKSQVAKCKAMTRSKISIPVPDLRRLVYAAGLGCNTASAVGVVQNPPE